MTGTLLNSLEILESRIAPAIIVDGGLTVQNSSTAVYTDVDGDKVTLKFNKKIFDLDETVLNEAFTLTEDGGDPTRFTLDSLDLSKLDVSAEFLKGLNLTISAQKKPGGDGLVDVGAILGAGYDLNKVSVDGSLAKITAGDADSTTAGLGKLTVESLGLAGGADPANLADVTSVIRGDLKSLIVKQDIDQAFVSVVGSTDVRLVDARIGGDLIGGALGYSGAIKSEGSITKIVVDGDLIGGAGELSGAIHAIGDIVTVKVGNILGDTGENSGAVRAEGNIGKATISGDIVGGDGWETGILFANGTVSSATIKGNIVGGGGVGGGKVYGGIIEDVTLKGDLVGGTDQYTGLIWATDSIGKVTVHGSLFGKTDNDTARIYAINNIGSAVVEGDLWGGDEANSGSVMADGTLSYASVKGDLHGNSGENSGSVVSTGGGMVVGSHGEMIPGTGVRSGGFFGYVVQTGEVKIVNANTATYTDVDGDKVTIQFNKNIFSLDKDVINEAFLLTSFDKAKRYSLDRIDLSGISALLDIQGLDISITSEKKPTGDGLVGVGAILGAGIDLYNVTVDGALAKITAGDANLATAGLNLLSVDSLGLLGASPSSLSSVTSVITGNLNTLQVAHDVNQAVVSVEGSSGVSLVEVTVGGNVIGGALAGSGVIKSAGGIGSVTVEGGILGGAGSESGIVAAQGTVTTALVKGDIVGGSGRGGGKVYGGIISSITLEGDLVGGTNEYTGLIWATDSIGSVTVNGSLFGKIENDTARIYAINDIASAVVKGDLWGGTQANSGSVMADGKLSYASVLGDLNGGAGLNSGAVVSTEGGMEVGPHGDTNPGTGFHSGGFFGAIVPPVTTDGGLAIQNDTTATFTDVDGDQVTVTSNKNIFALDAAVLNDAFVLTSAGGIARYLASIDLSKLNLSAEVLNGLDLTITAGDGGVGDGLVNVGSILGAGFDLHNVSVDGALAKITAGDANLTTAGLNSLSVDSLGLAGASPTTLASVTSVIKGNLNTLQVAHDVDQAVLSVEGSTGVSLGSATIGGDVIGGTLANSGVIKSAGSIGSVTVEGDILGGAGAESGIVAAQGTVTTALVKGDIVGGSGRGGGKLYGAVINSITLEGDLVGGTNEYTGLIWATNSIGSVTVNGSLFGKTHNDTARIYAINDITSAVVKGDLWGGSAANSGSVMADGTLSYASVLGDLNGGAGSNSGSAVSTEGGMVVGPHGDTIAGTGYHSGGFFGVATTSVPSVGFVIQNGTTATFTDVDGDAVTVTANKSIFALDGSVVEAAFVLTTSNSGANNYLSSIDLSKLNLSAEVLNGLDLTITADDDGAGNGLVNVGSILGTGFDLHNIVVDGALAKITAGDADLGTTGLNSLSVNSLGLAGGVAPTDLASVTSVIKGNLETLQVTHDVSQAVVSVEGSNSVNLGAATIGGNVVGGALANSGVIKSSGSIGSVTVNGDILGGAGLESGIVSAQGTLTTALVKGDIVGGSGVGGGKVYGGIISSITLEGDLVGGSAAYTGLIWATNSIGTVTVEGSLFGKAFNDTARIYAINNIASATVEGDLWGGSKANSGSVMADGTLSYASVLGSLNGGAGLNSGAMVSTDGGMEVGPHGTATPGSGTRSGGFFGVGA